MTTRWQRRFDDIAISTPGAPPQRRDWIFAAVLAAAAVAELVVADLGYLPVRLLAPAIAVAILPFRRQIPLAAAVAAFFAQFVVEVALELRNVDASGQTSDAHDLAGLALIYALCRWSAPSRVAVGMGLTMSMVLVSELVEGEASLTSDVLLVVPWVILALVALSMRYRARLAEQKASEIRLTERNALARDLHDTVAHHVSAIAVQAQAAQFVGKANPDAALEIMANVEAIANTAIDEMRRMVGILRSDADLAHTVAGTSLAPLGTSSGPPRVTITAESNLEHLPSQVAAAIYRISQESLTNARRHSRNVTFVDISLHTTPESATLEVVNDGTPTNRNSGNGFGLIGMSERVDALGGTIEAGPRAASGWRVSVAIPLKRLGDGERAGASRPFGDRSVR